MNWGRVAGQGRRLVRLQVRLDRFTLVCELHVFLHHFFEHLAIS